MERVGGGAFDGPNFARRAEAVVGVVNRGAHVALVKGEPLTPALYSTYVEVSAEPQAQ